MNHLIRYKYIFLLIVLIFPFTKSWSQNDISNISSIQERKQKNNFISQYFKDDYPSPKKAVILSAIVPGLGQIYNKKGWYIKLPLVYGAFGGLIYSIHNNGRKFRDLKEQYRFQVNELGSTNNKVNDVVLKIERDSYEKKLHLSYVGIGLVYVLTAVEAYTTAHLLTFDLSDDLSMQLKPSFDINPSSGMTMGFGVSLKIGNNKKIVPKDFLK